MKCVNADNDELNKLDFDIAIGWRSSDGRECSPDDVSTWPIPEGKPKCWLPDARFNVNVYVPPYLTVSSSVLYAWCLTISLFRI